MAVEETPQTAQRTEGTATQPESEGAARPAEDPVLRQADNDEDDEEDVNDTCGFCQFMRGGGCRRAFNAWSKCVDKEREDGADFATRCGKETLALRECMLQHRDYYAPLLEEEEEAARKAQEQEAILDEIQQERDRQRAAAATGVVDEAEVAEKPGVAV